MTTEPGNTKKFTIQMILTSTTFNWESVLDIALQSADKLIVKKIVLYSRYHRNKCVIQEICSVQLVPIGRKEATLHRSQRQIVFFPRFLHYFVICFIFSIKHAYFYIKKTRNFRRFHVIRKGPMSSYPDIYINNTPAKSLNVQKLEIFVFKV